MTKDQISLLKAFKDSYLRGSASMSCDSRRKIALELVKAGLLKQNGIIAGSVFYVITTKGMVEAERRG